MLEVSFGSLSTAGASKHYVAFNVVYVASVDVIIYALFVSLLMFMRCLLLFSCCYLFTASAFCCYLCCVSAHYFSQFLSFLSLFMLLLLLLISCCFSKLFLCRFWCFRCFRCFWPSMKQVCPWPSRLVSYSVTQSLGRRQVLRSHPSITHYWLTIKWSFSNIF